MSDYLWDKTGEPDAETERIENLLGQLRFQPTPFDLPAELPARTPATARTPRPVFSWPRLALAASLALAVLAGAWLMLRQQTGTTNHDQQVAQQNTQAGENENGSTAAPKAVDAASGSSAGDERKGAAKPAAVRPRVEPRRKERGAVPHRPRVPDLAKRRDNSVRPRVEPERREERAQLAAEREAAEKVLYALRVTSEKLNYARRQVQTTARGEDNR